jgi:CRISPR/Cas system-associated exonuclease Cas4 (RecB family)
MKTAQAADSEKSQRNSTEIQKRYRKDAEKIQIRFRKDQKPYTAFPVSVEFRINGLISPLCLKEELP